MKGKEVGMAQQAKGKFMKGMADGGSQAGKCSHFSLSFTDQRPLLHLHQRKRPSGLESSG